MKNIKRFKKYFYGMSVNPPPPPPQPPPHFFYKKYLNIFGKTRGVLKKNIFKKKH